jgi:uncharacterized membrane protein
VRGSEFSSILGIPVPLLGLAFYATFAALKILRPEAGRHQRFLDRVGLALAVVGLLTSGWFTYLEAFVIGAWCFWCLLSAACSVGLFGLAITLWVSQSDAGVGDET